jgi:hypothetical protein
MFTHLSTNWIVEYHAVVGMSDIAGDECGRTIARQFDLYCGNETEGEMGVLWFFGYGT